MKQPLNEYQWLEVLIFSVRIRLLEARLLVPPAPVAEFVRHDGGHRRFILVSTHFKKKKSNSAKILGKKFDYNYLQTFLRMIVNFVKIYIYIYNLKYFL